MATTLKTNQRDYFPGETVTLTLGEFDPGSSFVFAVRDSASDPGDDGVANVYSPFWVTDGGWGDRDGLVNGQIVAQWVVPSDPDGSGPLVAPALHATLEVTASTASTSGTGGVVVASTTFTDANPTPVQLFYVPMPENQLLQALQAIDTGNSSPDPVNPMQTYISIAASNSGTWIYYDHWEDGYEADISNPTQATTRVWGDGNLANGVAPGTVNDLITAGTVLVLNNPVDTNNPLPTDYDGGDKFAASKTVAVTRVGWASGSDTLLAGSVEVLDTNNWGTSFRAPVGQNIPNTDSFQMFEYTGLFIQAGEGGAVINVDVNANGLVDAGDVVNVALAEGKSYLVNDGVNIGATVTSSKPVQVDILTGDIGSNYESRDSALLPTNLWSNNYYTPVSTQDANATTVWLYNPGATSINVTYTYRSNSTTTPSTTITVAANSYAKQVIPDGSGARFHTASGANFYAFSTTDSNSGQSDGGGNQAYDWGFTLIPQYSLTNQVLIGLGIGRDPTSGTNPNENGNPVWVTPIGNGNTPVNVYVDRNNDGVVDQTLSLRELERAKVFDPDGNQTGMRIYTDAPGVKLAAAWGQDPASASPGAPGLDVGTGVPPLPQFGAGKNGTLLVDADGGGQITAGDTLLYTITIPNISTVPVPDVKLQDILPADTTYISNSTKINRGDGLGFVSIPDAGTTPFPLDEGGAILGTIPVGKTYTVTFEARIDAFKDLDPGRIAIVNNGTVNALGETKPISDTTPLYFFTNIDIEKFTNGEDADTPTGPVLLVNSPVVWTYEVKTTGNVWLSGISVTDSVFGVNPVKVDANNDTFNDGDTNKDNILQTGETWYFGSNATIDVEKYVSIDGGANWVDADLATGPYLSSGTDPQFKFVVTNTGNVDLANVTLTDSDFNIDGADKSVSIGALAAGASYELIYADAAWAAGQHTDTATASGEYTDDNGDTTTPTDTDDANYFGSNATIDVEKYVSIDGGANWVDADLATGPYLSSGTDPQFKFVVTNTGNVDLANVTLTDSDFNIDGADKSVSIGALAAGASYELIYADAAWAAGQHTDTATASGEYTDDNGDTTTPTDTDDANYFGSNATIDVEKYVSIDGGANWVDADLATGPYLSSGTDPQFKFVVTNTGNVDLANVTLTDSDFNIDGADKSVSIGALAAGASYELIYADAAWAAGQHTDTATASGEYTDDNGDTTTPTDTDDANYFGFEPTGSIGDFVWEDLNYNGKQDANEPGIAGVTVNLLDTNGNVVKTTQTGSGNDLGKYLFGNVAPGDYSIQVVKPSNGYFFTKPNVPGDDALDSDVGDTGLTAIFNLSAGENDLTVDAGLYRKANLGDLVWLDRDNDGIQDSNERGVDKVIVKLLDASGAQVAMTTTDASGKYLFSNLDPGSYKLEFDKSLALTGAISVAKYPWSSKQNQGNDDGLDSDVAGSGFKATTALFTLESGENDLTQDAAITPIVIDLNGDGIKTIARADSQGTFDLLGTGSGINSGWLSGDDGFLVIDRNGNGSIDDISEMFGGSSKGDGFAKLASFDSNADGMVNANDADFAGLKIWRDVNGNHQTDDGELMSLADAGLVGLSISYSELPFLDAKGNLHLERGSATRADGSVVDMTDVYFNISASDAAAAGVQAPTLAELMGSDNSFDSLMTDVAAVAGQEPFDTAMGDAADSTNGGCAADWSGMNSMEVQLIGQAEASFSGVF
jgi:uncharacterized repeat protein (TIGR01451 family)